MAAFNKTMLIGRLTADPEPFAGGAGAKFRFAVTNRKKNKQSGEWEDDPMFIDCDVFNRGEGGKSADVLMQYAKKGSQLHVEGKLVFEQWEDKNGGGKRSKHKVIVDGFQLLDPKPADAGGQHAPAKAGNKSRAKAADDSGGGSGDDGEIPF